MVFQGACLQGLDEVVPVSLYLPQILMLILTSTTQKPCKLTENSKFSLAQVCARFACLLARCYMGCKVYSESLYTIGKGGFVGLCWIYYYFLFQRATLIIWTSVGNICAHFVHLVSLWPLVHDGAELAKGFYHLKATSLFVSFALVGGG